MPHLQKTPYDPDRDFAPISLVALVPFALVTHPPFPAANAKEFIAHLARIRTSTRSRLRARAHRRT